MFKKLESAWNSRTPVWLHNGTKENIIFQLSLATVIVTWMLVRDTRAEKKALRELDK